ncbi:hypothetical protein FRX31_013188, partial [Thalictrum thalictroides]
SHIVSSLSRLKQIGLDDLHPLYAALQVDSVKYGTKATASQSNGGTALKS